MPRTRRVKGGGVKRANAVSFLRLVITPVILDRRERNGRFRGEQGGQDEGELEEGRDVGWADGLIVAGGCIETASWQCADEGWVNRPVS